MLIACALLALAWAGLAGTLTPASLAEGFVLGFFALWLVGGVRHMGALPLRRAPQAMALGAFFAWQLVLANLRVAAVVLWPRRWLRPGIVAVPLSVRSDGAIMLLANLITLTPGTLSVDVSDDRSTLYVHVLSARDPQAVRREIQDGFERRVASVLQ